jgi:transmembrane sensor
VSAPFDPELAHEEAAAWFLRLRDGTADQDAFEAWLAADPEHGEAFAATQDAWNLFDASATAPEVLAMRRDALSHAHRAGGARWGAWRPGRRSVAAAAVLALVTPLAAGLWFAGRPAAAREYRTGLGEQRTVTLADGSRVSLDANTVVKVAFSRDLRLIQLAEGRAHVEVAKDPSRPLKVRAGAKTVTAIGTAFTVERRAGDEVVVTLVEGRIAVTDERRRAPATEMAPQEQLTLTADAAPVLRRDVDVERALAWREGKLAFDDETLAQAAQRMNGYSATKLVVEGDRARNLRISGLFKAGDTAAFVEAVKAYFPIEADTSGETVTLRPRG